MRLAAAMLLIPALLPAQTVTLGLRAGIPVSSLLSGERGLRTSTRRVTIGPALEFGFSRGVAIAADLLFKGASPHDRVTVRRWELPLMLTYRLRLPRVNPFVRAGVSFNRVFGIAGAPECARGPFGERFYCVDDRPVAELRHRSTRGPVVGAGLRFRFARFSLQPEVRVTRWIDRNFGVRDSAVRSNLTQVEIVAGLLL